MGVFNKITEGFKLGVTSPVVAGQEDLLYIFNIDDIAVTFNPSNPLIVTGLAAVNGGLIYEFTGTNNSYKNSSKLNKTIVGPRYVEEIDFNIAGNASDIKGNIMAMGYGRVLAIVVNNFRATDAAVELFGANNGMIVTDSEKNEASEGGWTIKLGPPDKLMEPYPPRSVSIPPVSGPATLATTLAAIQALVSPT